MHSKIRKMLITIDVGNSRIKVAVFEQDILLDLIVVDPEILGGKPVFKGTRVPIKTLFDYLERGYTLDEFLECFPSVSKDLAVKVLERSEAALLAA